MECAMDRFRSGRPRPFPGDAFGTALASVSPRSGRARATRRGASWSRRVRPSWLGRLLGLLLLTAPVAPGAHPAPAGASTASSPSDHPSPGSAGIGDPYYPLLGNGGYDVRHYALDLDLDVAAGSILEASATIEAVATQGLSAFNLDFRGPEIDSVTVAGRAAAWERDGGELTVTPAAPLALGSPFTVVVRYAGAPDGGEDRLTRGWWATGRSIATVGEPAGADVWYPVNGHPLDKATYTLSVTVPAPYDVVANGRLVATVHEAGDAGTAATRTFVWENRYPTASYLVAFHAAELDVRQRPGPDGVVLREAFPPDLTRKERRAFARAPRMLEVFAERFGPYPFAAFGNTVLEDTAFDAALETQELVAYDRSALGASKVAHELAHQWFGNSVSLERWQDIWLNEGFASYAQVLWIEETRGAGAARAALRRRASTLAAASEQPEGTGVRIGDPGPGRLTSPVVYSGGALLLAALRERMGDDAFFRLLQEWTGRHRHGHADTQDFVALAEEVAQEELDAFFVAWLETPWTPERVAALVPDVATPGP
jgi:aminopeptidase N